MNEFKNENNFFVAPMCEEEITMKCEIPPELFSLFFPGVVTSNDFAIKSDAPASTTTWTCSVCPSDRSCVGCDEDCPCAGDEDDDIAYCIPEVDKIIFENMCTIVYWCDGTKTVVRCGEGDQYSRYAGFAAAVCKKLFGSTSNAMKLMDLCDVELQQQRERIAAQEAAKQEAERKAAKREEEKKLAEKKFHEDVSAALYQRRVEAEAKRIMKEMNENK